MVKIEKKAEEYGMACDVDKPSYPYGTEIDLSDNTLEQLGISDLDIDQEVIIHAIAFVCSRSENKSSSSDGEKSERKQMSFQITEVSVKPKGSDDPVTKLYG